MMAKLNDDQKAKVKPLIATTEKLVRQVNDQGLWIEGFIFNSDPMYIMEFGNCPHEGDELVALVAFLAKVVGHIRESEDHDISVIPTTAPEGEPESAQSIADRMVKAVVTKDQAAIDQLVVEYYVARAKEK